MPAFAVIYELLRTVVIQRLEERVRTGEIDADYLKEKLGVNYNPEDVENEDPEDVPDSQYVQQLFLLEEIAETPDVPPKNL